MTTSFAPEMSSSNELSDSVPVDHEHLESCNLTNHALETSATNKTSIEESDISCDVDKFFELRTRYPNNPIIGFLNINSIRYKINDLRVIIERCLPDIFVIEETKLCETFKTDAFFIPHYKKPMRRDRTQFGGGVNAVCQGRGYLQWTSCL